MNTTQNIQNASRHATTKDNIFKGVINAALAFFLLAVMGACAKLLTENHHIMEVAFYRNAIPFIIMFLLVLSSKKKYDIYKIKNKQLVLLRVLLGTGGLLTTFAALSFLPISEATVLFMAANLILPILAIFWLNEKVGKQRIIAIIIGFLGVFLVAAPSGQLFPIGVALALCAACFHATVQITLRQLKEENPFLVTFYFTLGGMCVTALFLPWVATLPQMVEIPIFLILGVSGGLAQYCLTNAFKYAPATIAAPFNYTGLLWATVLDIMIWGYIPAIQVYIGGAIIIGAKIYILHREHINKKKTDNENT